jgi:hypothetical protein
LLLRHSLPLAPFFPLSARALSIAERIYPSVCRRTRNNSNPNTLLLYPDTHYRHDNTIGLPYGVPVSFVSLHHPSTTAQTNETPFLPQPRYHLWSTTPIESSERNHSESVTHCPFPFLFSGTSISPPLLPHHPPRLERCQSRAVARALPRITRLFARFAIPFCSILDHIPSLHIWCSLTGPFW